MIKKSNRDTLRIPAEESRESCPWSERMNPRKTKRVKHRFV